MVPNKSSADGQSDPKVGQHQLANLQQDVAWLDVSMDRAVFVRMRECIGDLPVMTQFRHDADRSYPILADLSLYEVAALQGGVQAGDGVGHPGLYWSAALTLRR